MKAQSPSHPFFHRVEDNAKTLQSYTFETIISRVAFQWINALNILHVWNIQRPILKHSSGSKWPALPCDEDKPPRLQRWFSLKTKAAGGTRESWFQHDFKKITWKCIESMTPPLEFYLPWKVYFLPESGPSWINKHNWALNHNCPSVKRLIISIIFSASSSGHHNLTPR